jgi:tetratricopeptide (TPR) repeat protein
LSKYESIQFIKAGGIFCLFLSSALPGLGQAAPVLSKLEPSEYRHLFELRFGEVGQETDRSTAAGQYIANFSDALEVLLNEDPERIKAYLEASTGRLEAAASLREPAHSLWIRAELRFHRFLIDLKEGSEWDAAWEFRQCFLLVRECTKKHPDFTDIRKLDALLSIMLGSAPPRFDWILELLGMDGSIQRGISQLEMLSKERGLLGTESGLWLAFVRTYLRQDNGIGQHGLDFSAGATPLEFLSRAALYIKSSQSGLAIEPLRHLRESSVNIPFIHYLSGEVELQRGNFGAASEFLRKFLADYRGTNLVKDAWLKLFICRQLLGDTGGAAEAWSKSQSSGSDRTEADKHARALLAEGIMPNLLIARIRYATDGGFYETARTLVESATKQDLRNRKDSAEYVYRKARLLHKSDMQDLALPEYIRAIGLSENDPWYFAPNSALQAGYIEQSRGNKEEAARWFMKAMSYRGHEYKNSIDSKARTALDELGKK